MIENILLATDKSKVTVYDSDITLNKKYKISARPNKKDKFMHGIGLKNIKDTVYKYNGEIKIEFDDDKFVIKFIFSLKN